MTKQTTATSRKPRRSKMDLAVLVSDRVEILQILLTESLAKRGTLRDSLPAKLAMSINVQTKTDKKQRLVRVQTRFMLTAKYEDDGDEELLRIEAGFLLDYRVASFAGLKKASFDAFGELNGLYNAWPYWREFVQSTTVRMGLPALTIPVYHALTTETARKKPSPSGRPRMRHTKPTPAATRTRRT